MKLIITKIRQDIFQSLGIFIAITIILLIGSTFFVGLNYSYDQLNESVEQVYENSNLADLWVNVTSFNEKDIEDIKEYKGVENIEGRIQQTGTLNDKDINLYSLSKKINITTLDNGELPKDKDSIILESDFAKQNNYKVNDKIDVTINDTTNQLTVVGIFKSPEFIYYNNNPSQPVPDHNKFGIGIVDEELLNNGNNYYNQILIDSNIKNVEDLEKKIKTNYNDIVINTVERDKQQSYALVDNKVGFVNSVATSFPIIFVILGAMVTFISMRRQVENQRSQIAIMKALGTPNIVILSNFLLFCFLTSLIATVIGTLIGVFLIPQIILQTFNILFVFPKLLTPTFIHNSLIIFAIAFVTSCIATLFSCEKILKEKPAQALRPLPPKNIKSSFIEKIGFIWKRLSYPHRLILRNITMNKLRFIFSSLGVIFCVCIMVSSFGLKSALDKVIDIEFNKIRTYNIEVSLTTPIPNPTTVNDDRISNQDYFTTTSAIINNEDTRINVVEKDNRSMRITDENDNKIELRNDGIYVSQKFAEDNDIKVNDIVDLVVDSKSVSAEVLGSYMSYTSQGIYTTYDFLEDNDIIIPVSKLLLDTKSGESASSIINSLKNDDDYYNIIDKSVQLDDYIEASQSTNAIFVIMIIASTLLLFTIIYNITSMNIFERRRDIATEKVLGLLDKEIGRLILIENFILVIFSSLIGLLFYNGFYRLLCSSLAQDDMQFPSQLDLASIGYSLVLLLVFTYIANLFMKRKIKSVNMIEALKSVE